MVELLPVENRIDLLCHDCGAIRGFEGRVRSAEVAAIIRAFVGAHQHGHEETEASVQAVSD